MYAVILAGGSGTRFWPKSRKRRPKQLLNIVGSASMLRQTVERILPLAPPARILLVTGKELEQEVMQELPALPRQNFVLEPVARNTAPAIGLAAAALHKRDPEAVMAVLPADHLIQNRERLLQALKLGEEIAKEHAVLITLGIKPTRPETGYGYIEQGEPVHDGVFRVLGFTEKPDRWKAEEFVATGRFSWNSGMFIWKASHILSLMERFCPDLYRGLMQIQEALGTDTGPEVLGRVYEGLRSESIDVAIMEKARDILVIPVDLGWSDVGSWIALEEICAKDENGNILQGNPVALNTTDSILCSEGRLVAAVGVRDLIVVETDDAVLVCAKDHAQQIRDLIDFFKQKGLDQYL